jgi:hypothetical protein
MRKPLPFLLSAFFAASLIAGCLGLSEEKEKKFSGMLAVGSEKNVSYMVHGGGESIVLSSDTNGRPLNAAWTSRTGENVVVFFRPDGLPERLTANGTVVLFDNYRDSTADLAIVSSDGSVNAFANARVDLRSLNNLSAGPSATASTLKYASLALLRASCAAHAEAGALADAATACASPAVALGATTTDAGAVSNDAVLSVARQFADAIGCSAPDPLLCLSLSLETSSLGVRGATGVIDSLAVPVRTAAGILHGSDTGLSAPVLASPFNGQFSVAVSPVLAWHPVGGASSYALQVSTSPSFATPVSSQSGLGDTSATVSGLSPGVTYYWRVNAASAAGVNFWSWTARFTTQGSTQPSDLVVDSLVPRPDSGLAGAPATLRLVLRNRGSGNAAASRTTLRIGSSALGVTGADSLLTTVPVPPIAAGATFALNLTVLIPSGRPSGDNYLWATVDANGTAGQNNTANDRASARFRVTGAAAGGGAPSDLVIQTLTVSPASAPAGGTAKLTLAVRNRGAGPSVATTAAIRLGSSASGTSPVDLLLSELGVPVLAAGGSFNVTFNLPIPSTRAAGAAFFWITLDPNGTAGQSDRGNDQTSTAFTVTAASGGSGGSGQVDLIVQNLDLGADSGLGNSPLTVTFSVKNQGTGSSAASAAMIRLGTSGTSVGVADPLMAQVNVPALAAGSTFNANLALQVPPGRPAGAYFVWVSADANGTAGQGDQTNDHALAPFKMLAGPGSGTGGSAQADLTFQSFNLSTFNGTAGSSVTATFTVRNQGATQAAASTAAVRLAVTGNNVATSDTLLAQVNVPTLAAGATHNATANLTIPTGRQTGANYVWVTLDAGNTAGQANRNNDKAQLPFTVTTAGGSSLPDLTMISAVPTPASAKAGTVIDLAITMRNAGAGTSSASQVQVRLSSSATAPSTSDPILGGINAPPLAAGVTTPPGVLKLTIPSTTAPGSYTLWVIADPNGNSGQTNTANDRFGVVFTVTP